MEKIANLFMFVLPKMLVSIPICWFACSDSGWQLYECILMCLFIYAFIGTFIVSLFINLGKLAIVPVGIYFAIVNFLDQSGYEFLAIAFAVVVIVVSVILEIKNIIHILKWS